MTARTYDNFDLLIEAVPGRPYRARVVASPAGASAEQRFTLPFGDTQLENLLLKLDPGRATVRRGPGDARVTAGRELGTALFDAIFTGEVAQAWSRSRDVVGAQGKGLRLRLALAGAPQIAGLPWELLFNKENNTYLAQSERTPVVRYLDVPQTLRPLAVGGALHVLVIISAPTDLQELDVEAEWARAQAALKERVEAGTVVLHRLGEPTLASLGTWLRTHTAHVLHFIGHGDFDEAREDGVLYFCDRYGRSVPVTAAVLGPYVNDHDPLRLIVLNACRTASGDAQDPFAGMAQGLIQRSAGAVVAMQFPITDKAAMTFTEEFYGAIADEYPVDQAVTYARKALFATYGSEWATPTVFMESPDGLVFQNIEVETPAEPVPAVAVPEEVVPEPEPAEHKESVPAEAAPEPEPEPQPQPQPDAPPRLLDTRALELHHEEPPPRRRGALLTIGGLAAAGVVGAVSWALLSGEDDGTRTTPPGAGPTSSGGEASSEPTPSPTDEGTTPQTSEDTSQPPVTEPTASGPTRQPAVMIPAQPAVWMDAYRVEGVVLDGDAGEWPVGSIYDTATLVAPEGGPVEARDLQTSWRLGWDDDNLYLWAHVYDPVPSQAASGTGAWRGDSVHFEFGPARDEVSTETLDPADVHVIIGWTADGSQLTAINPAVAGGIGTGSAGLGGGTAVVVTDFAGKTYTVEASVPWSALHVDAAPAAGATFAMNLNVSDAQAFTTEPGALNGMWSNNPARALNDVKYRHLWGRLTLQP
ncbi:CHAT domain-containing protein [Ornithinimicrobium tianjinense]|uniref:CHAT domain-containing protein n=1 Tax=Ornithinimicrobium tianjinense TaxID=1195761 RepID=A0A917BPI0_9MICO|nr:CHAT domain-containing protein [Ornithinimicrobium tianjinense]GGF54191.1 hypothetical protein GCM10011366_22540 [Ornithinimicrobium tianjinense]